MVPLAGAHLLLQVVVMDTGRMTACHMIQPFLHSSASIALWLVLLPSLLRRPYQLAYQHFSLLIAHGLYCVLATPPQCHDTFMFTTSCVVVGGNLLLLVCFVA
jgi:hypothetical protein